MGRAERRKAERQERQYRVKNENTIRRLEQADALRNARIANIEKNGITLKELEENYNIGFSNGRTQGINETGKTMFAAAVLALHEEFGFGAERCYRLIKNMADKVVYALTSEDLMEQVMQDVGIEIDMDDPIEQVKFVKPKSSKWNVASDAQNGSKLPFDDLNDTL